MAVQRKNIWSKENPLAEFIPYSALIDPCTVKTVAGDFMQVIRVDGFAHESADDEDMNVCRDQLNQLFKNIASPDIAIWTHIVRSESNTFPAGNFEPGFCDDLNEKYKKHLNNTARMMVNKLYVTILYRQNSTKVTQLFSKIDKASENEKKAKQEDGLERIHELGGIVLSGLANYGPTRLCCYEKKGILFSETLEFLAYLINGEWQPFPVSRMPLFDALATSRPFFGRETYEVRGIVESHTAAMLAIKEYPENTEPGFLNALLSAPFALVLTQSFTFLSRPVSTELMRRQQARMINAGDLAESQIMAINEALDDITSGRYVMGEHHLNLSVIGKDQNDLKHHLSAARAVLADCGIIVAREDLALEAAFWAQLPGNFRFRPRPAPITSRNLAGFASLHNYPSGRRNRNQWGPAVSLLKTSSGAPYYFSFHEPTDKALRSTTHILDVDEVEDDSGQKALANTLIIGPSGSGKTVAQGFFMAQAQKFKPTTFIFDKDRGLEIFVRAQGGVYLPLKNGEPTGFNPLQLDPTPDNLLFLEKLVKKLVSKDGASLTNREEHEITAAVKGVMGLKKESRRMTSLLAFMDQTDPEGAGQRLSKWCAGGAMSWVFDNPTDELDFEGKRTFGFDVTEFLDDAEVRTPIIMYLFQRMESLIDGRRFICFMDEFWKLLLDSMFEDLAQNKLKVIRKQNGFLVFGTQSAGDVLKSNIAHSIVEQCATMIFMPNPKAQEADYVDGFKLTKREYQIIREELMPGSRRFLIKQGHSSVIAELNLQGFDDELAVISGTTDNVILVERIIEELGDDPATWLPEFHKRRKG